MITYKISPDRTNHFLNIEFNVKLPKKRTFIEVQLPAWRPGRYELGNFAKNIQKFDVFSHDNEKLQFEKITKDRWKIELKNSQEFTVKYNYYANEMNAGSTYVGDDIIYVNPVNCFLYVDDFIYEPCSIKFNIIKPYTFAGSLKKKDGNYTAKNFHELADSPFIVSENLIKQKYSVLGYDFFIWFYGEANPNWEKLKNDFIKFTEKQINTFGDFPVKKYHFLFLIEPFRAYHGVEHQNSTVIHLGPTYDLMSNIYPDLLGVSSHELYHTWNIKNIRPKEMHPYDYSKENYSRLGYVAEGVTTYMGDLMLFRSNVFSEEQYIKEFNTYLDKHFSNYGRENLSVAESSFDTWLDGYSKGIPNRKVSIYTEGCLISFMIDILILKATENKKSLNDVMNVLYNNFAKQGKGYTEQDYKNAIENISEISFTKFFNDFIWGIQSFENQLKKCLKYIGYNLVKKPSPLAYERFGIKVIAQNNNVKITDIAPNSSAEMVGLTTGQFILNVNEYELKNNFSEWFSYFYEKKKSIALLVEDKGKTKLIQLTKENNRQFYSYNIEKVKKLSTMQKKTFNTWKNC